MAKPNGAYDYNIPGVGWGPLGVLHEPTNIDRRQCKRVVPMKLLCLGCGRTGTSSLRIALMILGLNDVYHMVSMLNENPPDGELWVEAYEAKFEGKGKPYGREEWDKLLGHCEAVTDWPPAGFAEDLIAAYPDAKVLLTVRDSPEAWYKSFSNTIWTGAFVMGPAQNPFQWLIQRLLSKPKSWRALEKVFKHSIGMDAPERREKIYIEHNEKIRKLAAHKGKNGFLEYNLKQGWGPLCEFLGVPVPDVPFPKVNDTNEWLAAIQEKKMAGAKRMVKIVSVAVLGVSLYLGRARLLSLV